MISQDWCYNKRKVPAGAAAPVVWIERQENNMHISYKPLWHTLLERDMRKEDSIYYLQSVKADAQMYKNAAASSLY